MKTYAGTLRPLDGNTWLVADGGNPPVLGEFVTVGGRTAEVTASNKELLNDSTTEGRFIVVFKV